MSVLFTFSLMNPAISAVAGNNNGNNKTTSKNDQKSKRITPAERKAAADKLKKQFANYKPNLLSPAELVKDANGNLIPDYFGSANWAYSPPLRKFVDKLPGLGVDNANALGQYIPKAVPDTTTYPGSDYYEIAVVQYTEQMHSDLPVTTNRGYVQLSTSVVPGGKVPLTQDGTKKIYMPDGIQQAIGVDKPHFMGPAIIAESDRPVRIKFYNLLPKGAEGNLFIPVDTSVMGAGMGSMNMDGNTMEENYTQNRANIHLHGNNTVWISDGTPHQWITPAGETTHYPQGVSVVDVPDMNPTSVSSPTDGVTTLYYTNAQSARLMFYHDHSYGITRLNVYSGEAAAYILKDKVEKDLIDGTNESGVNPGGLKVLPDLGIPLVIQDRTFVDASTVLTTDPTWSWGTTPGTPRTGDLWYPHVYSPAQNPYDSSGANAFGRWMYGPWFWPPTDNKYGPIPNPYYDPESAPWEPPMIPSIPNPSAPGESFMDTPLVNGTAYPYMEVDPKAYRFRILNAANDRFFNLQMYVANDAAYKIPNTDFGTEVKMIPVGNTPGIPADFPSGIPDPSLKGPDWIQIGTEGGFLPEPVVIPSQPITWNLAATNFNFGNVDQHSLLLGTAERADVIVDFSKYAGKTLILYNDAPAAFPAGDPRYDYYTGNEDLTAEGGAPTTKEGFGPNTRTIMQIRVANSAPAAYDINALKTAFAKTSEKRGVFEVSQEPIIIPQAAYNSAYNVSNLPTDPTKAFVLQHEFSKTFQPINSQGILQSSVTMPLQPKAMQDEMGEVFDEYGRMSGYLGLSAPVSSSRNSPFIAYGYPSPPVDIFEGIEDIEATPIGSQGDGTQIWKITHNGVDTHTIHTHLFAAQLVNRVAWDGAMMKPDPNEIGYKETFRVNPLEHTIIAMRPKVPSASQLPFDVPNSERLIDPTMPEGAVLNSPPPAGWFDPQGNPITQILNHKVNLGWEYVYHCHILSHEEMDMMHSVAVAVKPKAPTALTATQTGNGNKRAIVLNWKDNSLNETNFVIERSTSMVSGWTRLKTLASNTTTYTDPIGNTKNVYYYRVYATNTVGDVKTSGFPTKTASSGYSNIVTFAPPAAPSNVVAVLRTGPQVLLTWKDNADNETGYIIEMSTNSNFTSNLVTYSAAANITTYQTGNLARRTRYYFRVKAVSGSIQSAAVNASPFPITTP
jgi:FtsP/CotA-like multicopper oxidase with cupredoxin domain